MANRKPVDIYIRLLNPSTEQWRIAQGIPVGDGLYELLGPVPESERWEFQPGQVVECEEVVLFFGDYGLLARRALPPDPALDPGPGQVGT